jgi:hypothetical protein
MSLSVKVLGAKRSAANIRRMTAAVRKKFYEQMLEICEEIRVHAQTEYVPVLTGALRDSGKVVGKPGRYPVIEIGFGGAAVDYAVIQHENLTFQHPSGGRAKYLELAVRDFEPKIAHTLEVAVRHETRKFEIASVRMGG